MREVRIFVDVPLASRTELDLPRAAAEHLLRVLRLGAEGGALAEGDQEREEAACAGRGVR